VFTLEDVKAITDYITNTYYRHYKLYTYVFNKRQFLSFNIQTEQEAQQPKQQQLIKEESTLVPIPSPKRTMEDNLPNKLERIEDEGVVIVWSEEKLQSEEKQRTITPPKTPLEKLTQHVETIASQSASIIVLEHMSQLKEELEKQLKLHEEQLLLKV
jgi:hypothetical protein